MDEVNAILAARLLVRAYRRALSHCEEVDWSDLDEAAEIAAKALGEDLNEPLPEDLEPDDG